MINWFVLIVLTDSIYMSRCSIYFITEPCNEIVKHNSSLILPCQAGTLNNDSLIIINWIHNGSWLTDFSNKHFYIMPNGSLYFNSFLWSDVGTYQCSAMVLLNEKFEKKTSRNASVQIAYLEKSFSYTSQSQTVLLGKNVQIQCISPRSQPYAIIYWQFNELYLHGNTSDTYFNNLTVLSSLHIKQFSLYDIGSYRCVAYNNVSKEKVFSSTMNLTAMAEADFPYFVIQPSSKLGIEFKPLIIDCVILGNPTPSVSWMKNSVKVLPDDRLQVLSNGSLLILKLRLMDAGFYVCSGENVHGSIQSFPPVQILIAYVTFDFLENPASQNVLVGQSFTLNCVPPKSYPGSVITWFKEFSVILPNDRVKILVNNSLTIIKVKVSDEGRYFCEAANAAAKASRTSKKAVVGVMELPTFQSQNRNISLQIGGSLFIYCNVSGRPKPNIKIYRKVKNELTVLSLTETYAVQSVSNLDQGIYVCFASNEAGDAELLNYVTLYTSPVFLTHPFNKTVKLGESIELSCKVNGYPYPNVYWFYENQILPFTNISMLDILYIDNITKKHEGFYFCVATNTAGKTTSNKGYLQVLVPPIIKVAEKICANISSLLVISCIAYGNPTVSIQWVTPFSLTFVSVNSNTVQENDLFYTISNLTISKVSLNNSGIYKCLAINDAGNDCVAINVTIEAPPSIISFDLSGLFIKSSNINISCQVLGTSLNVYFKHNSSVLLSNLTFENNYYMLLIQSVTFENSGSYSCYASNTLGEAVESKEIIIKDQPYPPTVHSLRAFSADAIKVSWNESFDGHSPIVQYIIEYTANNQSWKIILMHPNSFSANVLQLKPYTTYYFRLKAKNAIGESTYSQIVKSKTLEGVPSTPINLTCLRKNSTSILLQWYLPEQTNGIIKVFKIVYTIGKISEELYHFVDLQHSVYQVWLTNLQPYQNYNIKLNAATGDEHNYNWGNFTETSSVKTCEGIPNVGRFKLQSINISLTSFEINFRLETNESANGVILGYVVNCISSSSKVTINTTATTLILENLTPYTEYSISVAIFNKVGIGNFSLLIIAFTKMGVPGAPANVQVNVVNATAAKLSWFPPKNRNGVIKNYEVNISEGNTTMVVLTKERFLLISLLQPNTTYTAYVVAFTEAGQGNASEKVLFKTGLLTSMTTRVPVRWLEREYMIVIVAVSALSVLLLFILVIVILVKIFYKEVKYDSPEKEWENKLYNCKEASELIESDGGRNSTFPAGHINDLIWDDDIDSNNNLDLQYAGSMTPKFIKKGSSEIIEDTKIQYCSVEPYQGMTVETSPLVKLKGSDVKFERVRILCDTSTQQDDTFDRQSITLNSLNNPPSLSNLDLIENETDFSDDLLNESFQQ